MEAHPTNVGSESSAAAAHYQLGRTHQKRGEPRAAIVAYQRALTKDPERAAIHIQLGLAQAAVGATNDATASYQRAAVIDPGWPLPAVNLGILALAMGRTDAAIGHFRVAVDQDPSFALAHQQLAYALLENSQLAEGFRELEWRFDRGGATPPYPGTHGPVWDGRPRPNQTLVIFCEQGFGTRMQWIRFATLAAQRVGRVVCVAEGPEARLLATCPGVAQVVTATEPLPAFDVQAPLVSLPRILDTTLATIPTSVPYLTVPSGIGVDECALGDDGHRRIGFVWASGPCYKGVCRDAPLDAFARLAAIPKLRLFSFQFDDRRAALERCDAEIVDLAPRLGDFAQTAAYCARMDLVITVDTALAHLAGALGKPVWLLLPHKADWRWLQGRDTSPWYPTMRLYRQQRIGDWAGVFRRVVADLC